MKRYIAPLLVVGLFLLLSVFVPTVAQDDNRPEPIGLRSDAPTYAVHGPYWVGTQELVMDAETENAVPMTVWYPALNPDGVAEAVEYPVLYEGAMVDFFPPEMQPFIVYGKAIANAQPDISQAPYPLVIFSHGTGWQRQGYANLNEHLASWGFIVIAPSHLGESASEPLEESALTYVIRALVIQRAIAYANDTLNASDGILAGMVNADTTAIMGHSYGGWTSLLAGGALLNTANWSAWCSELPERATWFDCMTLAYKDQMATLIGLDKAPDGLWIPMNDSRVDAIIDMSNNAAWMFGEEGLGAIMLPIMSMMGTSEFPFGSDILPPDSGPLAVYDAVSSEQNVLVIFENGSHILVGNTCDYSPWWEEIDFGWVCEDGVWDMLRAHDLINHFTTAFLLSTLYGDSDATIALSPDAVDVVGVQYQAKGF